MYRKLTYIFLAAAIGFALSCTGCKGSGNSGQSSVNLNSVDPEGNTGSLIINISSIANRLILTEEDMVPYTYIITGEGPDNSKFTRTIVEETTVEIHNLLFGQWIIFVEALNENNVSIAGGESTVIIHSGQTSTCDILVEPFTGAGILDLVIDYPSDVEVPSFEITLTRKGYDPFELGYELNDILDRAEVYAEIEAGYYTLRIELYDETDSVDPYVGGAVEVVRIAQGQTTSETITITRGASGSDPGTSGPDSAEFPSPGAPEGSDAISSSTNQSGKEAQTSPELNPLAGAAFVQAPQIGNYGSVSLGYAIDTPSGRAGIQPSVGLSYSSSGGDGLVGIGWSLGTGLGVISRTTRYGELYYDQRDVFTYNGKRLVKVQGPEDSETGIYRMEIESGFMRFELTDTDNGGVWHVFDKNGTITVFGEKKSERIYRPDDEDKTYIWNFSRSYDLNGNYMQAVYDDDDYEENHILYLKEIKYTGNYNTVTPAKQWVRFTYKDREEAYVSKSAGFIMKMARLLDTIEVGWNNPLESGTAETLWSYEMVYETSEDSGRPLLKTVESTRNTTKPEFIYQEAEHLFTWSLVNNPDYNSNIDPSAVKYFEGDFNGDGLSDMVFFNPETGLWKAAEKRRDGGYNFPTYENRYRGYDTEQEIQFFKGNVTGDYNGDGRSDIAFYLPETRDFIVAEHTGTGFSFKSYGRMSLTSLDIFRCEWFTGDYDGNGLSDAVLFDETTGNWWLMANKGGSFSFIMFSKHFQNLYRDDYSPDSDMDSASTSDDSEFGKERGKIHFLSGDYNGDGRTDISIYDSRTGRWWVAENYRDESIGFRLNWKLYKVFTAPEQALFGNDRFSGDFNGDGFSDFLLFDRETGDWILGAVQNSTIQFTIFSRAPQFKKITRWLQGDFNGDGRTDIGFYSRTDNNFWIGEATQNGFRYRIYNNLAYGPDPDEVLKTPLPKDEIRIRDGQAVVAVASGSATYIMDYKFDGNYYMGKGEKVFTGNFNNEAGALIYRRNTCDNLAAGWYYAAGDGNAVRIENSEFDGFDPEEDDITILNGGRVYTDAYGNDSVLYYRGNNEDDHIFGMIYYNGTQWRNKTILSSAIDFSINTGLYLFGDFLTDAEITALVLNYVSGTDPYFISDSGVTFDIFYNDIYTGFSGAPEEFQEIFTHYASIKNNVFFFTGDFGDNVKILMVDTRVSEQHVWYSAEIADGNIIFYELEGGDFENVGYEGIYRTYGNTIVYATVSNSRPKFYEIIYDSSVTVIEHNALNSSYVFEGVFTHEGNPVLKHDGDYNYFDLYTEQIEELSPDDSTIFATKIGRDELIENFYPYRWIQGDYNGDSKTDIGIFHLGESIWYFANTTGTVPDMITEVKNGIGGTYKMEYINSSSLDNTGEDDIPDLPMNYKVCSKLTVEDGRGNRIVTKYEYKDGYAFSGFINGFKETDYFGFGEFTVIDALGSKTISTYNNVPYDDFRKNRALAGAIKESRFLGYDNKEYSRTEYEYKIHEIETPNAPVSPLNPPEGGLSVTSYLVEPVEVRRYRDLVLTEIRKSNIVLVPYQYEMESKTESITDHYSDSVHTETTVPSYSEYENLRDTNEMRLILKKEFLDTQHEVAYEYEYDYKGNLIREVTSYTGSGLQVPEDRVIEYEYDDFGNRIVLRDESGLPMRITERSYSDQAGLYQFLTQERSYTGTMYITTRYAINYASGFGQIASITDPNGNSTYFDYDDYGRLFRQRADTDYGDRRVINEYYYTANLPEPLSVKVIQYTGTTDPDIETRVFTDGMGRTIHTVRSAGPNSQAMPYTKTGLLVYDPAGRLIRKSQTHWASDDEIDIFKANTVEKNPTKYEYDASGRQTKIIEPKAFAGEPETSISYTYNDPWETVTTHSIGRSKRTVTNARGQVLYVEDSGTGTESGTVSAAMGFAYDISGNRIKKMDIPAPLPAGPLNPPEEDLGMDLTVNESLFDIGVKDNSGSNICQWKYDGFGRLVESSDPDMGYIEYQYNAFGDVTQRTDGLGRITTMSYDRLGRLTAKILPGTEGSVYYDYDAYSGSENAIGRIAKIDDPAQVKIFSYDRMGRIDRETRTIKSPSNPPEGGFSGVVSIGTFVTNFEYDLMNRKRSILYPQDPKTGISLTARYAYSSAGVSEVSVYNSSGRKDIISGIFYNEFGQMTEIDRSNGTSTHYEYDIKGRLSSLVTFTETNNQTRKLQDVSYAFRIDGSIASILNTPDIDPEGGYYSTMAYDYAYDGLARLVKAEGLYKRSSVPNSAEQYTVKSFERGFEYAANGNMLAKNIYDPDTHTITDGRTYSYGQGNHAVTSIESSALGDALFEMEYDAVGNIVEQTSPPAPLPGGEGSVFTSKTMEYDSYNRIVLVTNPDEGNEFTGQYWYDDQGFRVRKVGRREISGETRDVEVLYPSMYFGIEKHRTTAGVEIPDTDYAVNNIYLDGVRIAAVIPSGDARYYLTDQVDSVKAVVDDSGLPVTRMEYIPYGETWFTEGDENNAPKYNSQELDKETGFYYYNARHYNAEASRFVTPDTIIDGQYDTQGWNRYSYTKNNPIMYKDPTGHYTIVTEFTEDRSKVGEATLYDDEGNKIGTYKILGKGVNRDERTKPKADTPTGIFKITEKTEYTEEDKKFEKFGPLKLHLEGEYGEAKEAMKERTLLRAHGGPEGIYKQNMDPKKEGAKLKSTYGCLRFTNKDAEDIANKIRKIEEKRGHKSGKDPDVVDSIMIFNIAPMEETK